MRAAFQKMQHQATPPAAGGTDELAGIRVRDSKPPVRAARAEEVTPPNAPTAGDMFGFIYRGVQIGSTFDDRTGKAPGIFGGRAVLRIGPRRNMVRRFRATSRRIALRRTNVRQVRQLPGLAFVKAATGARAFSQDVRHQATPPADGGIDNLAGLFDAIADEVRRMAGSIEDAIVADFANRMQNAKQRAPKHELAATLAALQQARRAALIAASRNAAMELQGRRRAIARVRGPRSAGPRQRPAARA